jgi:hypothetical protein
MKMNGKTNVGVDPGSPVSLDYFDRAPFKFIGKLDKLTMTASEPSGPGRTEPAFI